jgi:hypothetical protein
VACHPGGLPGPKGPANNKAASLAVLERSPTSGYTFPATGLPLSHSQTIQVWLNPDRMTSSEPETVLEDPDTRTVSKGAVLIGTPLTREKSACNVPQVTPATGVEPQAARAIAKRQVQGATIPPLRG